MNPRLVRFAVCFSGLCWLVCAVVVVLLLTGCTTTPADRVSVPVPPAWALAQDARPVTSYEAKQAILKVAPLASVRFTDDTYTRVSYLWLQRYVSWTWEAAKDYGIRYMPESFDCENFSRLFNEIARARAAAAGQRTAPLLAEIIVQDGARRHCVVGVFTDRGFVIVDPQPEAGPFRIKPVEAYKFQILEVEL